jgi:hypothetical protein
MQGTNPDGLRHFDWLDYRLDDHKNGIDAAIEILPWPSLFPWKL